MAYECMPKFRKSTSAVRQIVNIKSYSEKYSKYFYITTMLIVFSNFSLTTLTIDICTVVAYTSYLTTTELT